MEVELRGEVAKPELVRMLPLGLDEFLEVYLWGIEVALVESELAEGVEECLSGLIGAHFR